MNHAKIIIIKGHSLQRACLQTYTQNSKPRLPTANTKWKGKLGILQEKRLNAGDFSGYTQLWGWVRGEIIIIVLKKSTHMPPTSDGHAKLKT